MEAAPAPVAAPAEEEPVTSTKTETAKEAADRAERAAERAESAAEKAEATTAPAPVPTPAPTPAPTLEPAAPQCEEGAILNIGRYNEQVCRDGHWVSAAPNRHCAFGGKTPSYQESGTTERRVVGGQEYTYRCEDGQLTLVEDGEG